MAETTQVAVGNRIRFARANDTKHMEIARDPISGAIELRKFDADGFAVAAPVVDSWNDANGYRSLAANTDPVLNANDKVVEVSSTDTSTVAVTTASTPAPAEGRTITLALTVRSSTGSFTLAATRGATAGTITLDAVGEGAIVTRNAAGVWKLIALLGGSTFA